MTSSHDGNEGPSPNSIAGLSLSIFSDILSNLTHDLVLQSHRQEKLRSRAHLADSSSSSLTSLSETTCPRCNLPQHTAQTLQSVDTADKKKFCSRPPFQNTPYHDIYGNPFPAINNSSAKEKKSAAASAAAVAAADSPTPDPSDTAAPAPKGKNSGIVYFKCTSCDNEKVASSRYAAHLEKCLGLSGRKSSRAAVVKMNSSSGGGSPMLAPVDAPGGRNGNGNGNGGGNGKQGGSRKPSPEKKSPVPPPAVLNGAEETKTLLPPPITTPLATVIVSGGGSVPPITTTTTAATTTTATPKKKKKKAAVGANVPVPIPPTAISHDDHDKDPKNKSRDTSISQPTKDAPAPPKKRKRKAEADGTINVSAIPAASSVVAIGGMPLSVGTSLDSEIPKPPPIKKQKVVPGAGGSETPISTKKSQLGKFSKNRQSPTPGNLPKKPPISAAAGVGGADRITTLPPAPPPTSTPKPAKPKVAKPKIAATAAASTAAGGTASKVVPRPIKKPDGVKKVKGPGKAKVGKVAGKGIGAGKAVVGSSSATTAAAVAGSNVVGGANTTSVTGVAGSTAGATPGHVAGKGVARKGT